MSSIFKRGDVWQYQSDDRSIRKSLHTADEQVAKMLQNKLDRQAYYSENGLIDRDKTWDEFKEEYFTSYKNGHRWASLRQLMRIANGFGAIVKPRKLIGITRPSCDQWVAARLDSVSPRTVKMEIGYLGPMFLYAHQNRYIEANPFFGITAPDFIKPKPVFLGHEEVQKFMAAVHAGCPEYDAAALLAYETGMRLDEILHQRPQDTDLDAKILRIREHRKDCACIHCDRALAKRGRRGWIPKTESSIRDIPLSDKMVAALRAVTVTGGVYFPQAHDTIGRAFMKVFRKVGIPGKARVHVFRHTMATDMERAGIRPAVKRDILGHSPTDTTGGYTHATADELHDGLKKLLQWREDQGIKLKKTEVEGLRIVQAA